MQNYTDTLFEGGVLLEMMNEQIVSQYSTVLAGYVTLHAQYKVTIKLWTCQV